MNEHKHTFNLGFLNYNIEVILTDDISASRSDYDQQVGHSCDDLDSVLGLHSCNTKRFDMISFIFVSPTADISTIAHEAFHAAVRVCKVFEIPLKEATEEVYAYMLDFIVSEIVKFKDSIALQTT